MAQAGKNSAFEWIDRVESSGAPSVVIIGNFDGVHLGHQRILAEGTTLAKEGLDPYVLTFDPHPEVFFGRAKAAPLLTLERRAELLHSFTSGRVIVQPFDEAFSSMTALEFAERLLSKRLRARAVVVGENFHFGKGREGDVKRLRKLGDALGFATHAMNLLHGEGEKISSSRIRSFVTAGDVRRAGALLGRPPEISGRVERGAQRGRTLGFPTINVGGASELHPGNGVYAVRVALRAATHVGVANIGHRPTVREGLARSVEAHLFDFEEDVYGEAVRIEFVDRLRGEEKFENLEALRTQIDRDCANARSVLKAVDGTLD